MKFFKMLFAVESLLLFIGCVSLNPTDYLSQKPIICYKYVYITPITLRTSVTEYVGANLMGNVYSSYSTSVSPSEHIASSFMNRGYIKVVEIKPEYAAQTLVINYGEGNVRHGLDGSAIEVTLQVLDGLTNELVCKVRADGLGRTEAEARRNALDQCLERIVHSGRSTSSTKKSKTKGSKVIYYDKETNSIYQ